MAPTATHAYDDCLTASWLSARLAVDVQRIEAMRRSGELIAVRPEGLAEWRYPSWQFAGAAVRPVVPRLVAAARSAGLDERRLYELLTMRAGLGRRGDAERRLADLVLAGEDEQVVAAVRAASRGR